LAQDVLRKKGSFEKTVSTIKELLNYPDVELEVNSVFTPTTVDYLSESIKSIMDLGVPSIHFSLSVIKPWDQGSLQKLENEMMKLVKILISNYKKKGNIPVANFREEPGKGIFYCAAGKDRLAITPDEEIWGCFLFPDYFRGKEDTPGYNKFYFGSLDKFIENHKSIYPRILSNYAKLSMDNFSASRMGCFLCPELENCAVCPINASFSGNPLGKIPSYLCKIQKIKIKEKQKLSREIRKIQIINLNKFFPGNHYSRFLL
jgi:sulfatase maturation enzyme AslB (radical SAM superfamily)